MTAQRLHSYTPGVRRFSSLLCVALLLVGCAPNDASSPDAELDAAQRSDSGSDATDSEAGGTGAGELQIGTNPAYEAMPQSFTPMSDGAEVPITFGVQGSWMVVLAFRTRDMFEGQFDVVGEITIDGVQAGRLWLELQETFPGGDGWDYYYNFFLAIDHEPARGTPTHILVRVTDEEGATAQREHDVLIGPADGG